MKTKRDFVSTGELELSTASTPFVYTLGQPRTSQSHPADLPRDYGMAGAVGAYEVKSLTQFVSQAVEGLEASAEIGNSVEHEVAAHLDRLMAPAERHKLAVEHVSGNVVTLSMANKRDRFLYNRVLVPKLVAALRPTFGVVRIQLTERL